MATTVMLVLMFVLLALGVPIGVALSLPLLVLILISPVVPASYISEVFYSGVASFTMIAMPFFMLAGSVMDSGGLSTRLVRIANSLIGRVTGSLGLVTVIACMFFGAVSGSANATVAAIGAVMIPQMVRNGYDKYYAVALVAAAGSLGIIVPPSFPMVVYAVTLNVSVGTLFIAGIGPALVVGLVLIVINYFYCKKHNIRGREKASLKEFWAAMKDGWPAMLMPVIILGGIYGGIFSATEASVVSVVYGIIIGAFYYRELKLSALFDMYRENAIFIGGTMLVLAPSAALGKIFAIQGVTHAINAFFLGISTNQYVILTLIFGVLFIAGMFVQTMPCIVILGPLLYNVAASVGVDPIHFGVVMILALSIAFVTPPVASNLFVASSMTGLSIMDITKAIIPFILGLILCLFIVGFFPQISWFFVNLLG